MKQDSVYKSMNRFFLKVQRITFKVGEIRSNRFEFATKTPTLFPGSIFDLDLLLWFYCVLAMRKRQPLSVK